MQESAPPEGAIVSAGFGNGTNMKNTTPIMALTGLAIVAAVGIAGVTRDRWMGAPAPAVAPAETAAPAPAPAEAPVATAPAPAPAPAEQPAPATEAAAPAAPAAETAEATPAAPAQPEAPKAEPVVEQPATNAVAKPEVPAFDTVRVDKTGEAVIAGRAEAGSEVVVKLNGMEIGKTVANADGAFVVVPDAPLPAGSGAMTIEAKGKGDLNPINSEQSVAVIVPEGQPEKALVAVVSPDAPTKVLQKPEVVTPEAPKAADAPAETPVAAPKPAKLVSIDAVDYDPAGNIVFSGQGEKGNTARIYVDNAFIGDAVVGDDGRWTFSGTTTVAKGVHTLRVDGLDGKGSVVNRVEVPFFREDQTKVADAAQPAAPAAVQPEPAAQPAQAPAAEVPAAAAVAEQPAPAPQPAAEQQTTKTAEETVAATAPVEAAPAPPKEGRVVIQPGNNLWRISRVLYGNGNKFTMLYEANKDQIRNPNLIYPGQIFKTPDVAPKAETIDPSRRDPLKPEENSAGTE